MKNVYFAVAIVLLAFLACSTGNGGNGGDDDGGNPSGKGACYLKYSGAAAGHSVCEEPLTKSVCDEVAKQYSSNISSHKFQNSCPSGQDLRCSIEADGEQIYASYYGPKFEDVTCADMGFEDAPSKPSSNSRPSSSSKGGSSAGSGSQTGVCYFPNAWENQPTNDVLGLCIEGESESLTRSDCEDIADEDDLTLNFRASCPTGYGLQCGYGEDDVYLYAYLYGDEAIRNNNITCRRLNMDPVTDRSSSSKKASSSSAAGGGSQGACYVSEIGSDYAFCMEPMTRSECEEEDDDEDYNVSYRTSCPSGYECKLEWGEMDLYFYGEDAEYICYDDGEYGLLSKAKSLPKAKGLSKKGLSKIGLPKGLFKVF